MAQSLTGVMSLPPDSIPAEQKQPLITGAEAADAQLGKAVAGFFNGNVDVETLRGAITSFEQGLTQGEQQLKSAQDEIDSKQKVIDEGLKQLAAAERKLAQGEADYAAGISKLGKSKQEGEESLAKAKVELDQGLADYNAGLATYKEEKEKADQDIKDGEHDISEGQQKLDELELPKYYVLDRSSNPGYTEFSDNADRLASIATAFPFSSSSSPPWSV